MQGLLFRIAGAACHNRRAHPGDGLPAVCGRGQRGLRHSEDRQQHVTSGEMLHLGKTSPHPLRLAASS